MELVDMSSLELLDFILYPFKSGLPYLYNIKFINFINTIFILQYIGRNIF